ncbi:class D sortase [Neobacillus thermocopriae]|uniref:Class D sortase n=1 Tax=Neobacillus thermocopriae TaxID=1215031 RepID=A0A6B3TP49_9BACI|nr:class D sortase [Neobacillus thermocopriae]MED3623635.1 class D sortase [Neobacillus thermocopriae]MED3712854.1 class D sortase [Neobacillus thermocopriae]NEX78392.1 class D sortase [Neobacillus thermocopriae]
MKKVPLLLILTGIFVIGFSLWQLIDSKIKTNTSLKEAKKLVIGQTEKQVMKKRPLKNMVSEMPKMGDTIGLLVIPRIKAELAIIEGTDPDELEKGVGHFKGSFFPGENGQIVLSGHRDTVFRRLGELKVGDLLTMQMPYGTYQYEITNMKIVDEDDRSIITLQNEKEELILTTCYPFHYIGNAPQRYIIYAKLKNPLN